MSSNPSGNVAEFAVPGRRRVLVRKRPGQRQTTRRPYGSVLLTPPGQQQPSPASRAPSSSPRAGILGRASPTPKSASPAMSPPGGTPSPSLAAAGPSPSDPSPAPPSPVRPTTDLTLPTPGASGKKATKRRERAEPQIKKRQRGSSAEAMLALRQVEALVASRRADEEQPEMHELCRKFVREVASELSQQAEVINENAHLIRAHSSLTSQKRELKAQLLHLQQQRSQISEETRQCTAEINAETSLHRQSLGLSDYLYKLQELQSKSMKKATKTTNWDTGAPENLGSLAASAVRNSQHLSVLQHTNAHLEAMHAIIRGIPKP